MKLTGRLAAFAVSGVLMTAVWSGAASAIVVLDQDHIVSGGNTFSSLSEAGFGRAQTFTVGVAGTLDSIDVDILSLGGSPLMRILGTTGGVPDGGAAGSTVLASSSSFLSIGNIHTFDFSGDNLLVDIGDIFAIEVIGSGQWRGIGGDGSSYPDGSDFFFNTTFASIENWTASGGFDNSFRTFVDTGAVAVAVPEPSTAALGIAGLGAFAWCRWRRGRARPDTGNPQAK